MIRNIVITFLVVLAVGTGYWGYQEHQEKNAILIHAENGYQQAFHDLAFQIDLLHDKIGSTLAMNSRSSISPALVEVWRITSNAHKDVGQLPLTLLPFNKTEEFLSKIGDFSYRTAVRDLEKEPLSEEEYKTLQELYDVSKDIQQEIRTVQHKVLSENLRWMDVEMALASEEKVMDNTIINGFKTVEKNMESYSEVDFGPTVSQIEKSRDTSFKYLEGKEISEEEAKKKAKEFLELNGDAKINVVENGEGSDFGFYSITIDSPKEETEIYMDITKKGGYPIWVIQNREIGEKKLSLNQAAEKASQFLNDHEFENLEIFESSQYDNVGVFKFVATKDNIRIYPDAISIKVSLDEGHIVGFSARDYLQAHHQRDIPEPEITEEEALTKVNPNVKVMEKRLAVIQNDLGEEVLCYEIMGTIDQNTYRIYLNASDNREEKVQMMKNAEPVF